MSKLKLGLFIVPAGFMSLLIACGQDHLVPLERASNVIVGYGNVEAKFCTSAPVLAKQNLKYLFILDHSSSNTPGFPSTLTPTDVSGTDPQGSRRYGPLINFTSNLASDDATVTSFGLIDFNDTASQLEDLIGFTSDVGAFNAAVTADWIGGGSASAPAPNDSGFTNYQSALQLALQMIRTDAQSEAALQAGSAPVSTSYVVVFVSDGVPAVTTTSGTNPIYVQDFVTDIQPVLENIMAVKSEPIIGQMISGVSFNTAYYFNDANTADANAKILLNKMAEAGDGQALTFGAGENVLYQQFAPPSRRIRNLLSDVFVENINTVWADDGAFMADSDGDGLADATELEIGANPGNRDSDGNGVNDLVEYRTKGRACDASNCAPGGRDPYAMCAGFSPTPDANGAVTFASSSNDGLNDCEKFVLGALRNTFNTNGNFIPDELALRQALPIIPGSANVAFADPFNEGLSNYSKLKKGLPAQVASSVLTHFDQRSMRLLKTASPSPDIECYNLQALNIALGSKNNVIRVHVVQNGSALEDKPFLKTATGIFAGRSTSITLAPTDFK